MIERSINHLTLLPIFIREIKDIPKIKEIVINKHYNIWLTRSGLLLIPINSTDEHPVYCGSIRDAITAFYQYQMIVLERNVNELEELEALSPTRVCVKRYAKQ